MQLENKNTCKPYSVFTVSCNKQGFTGQSIDKKTKLYNQTVPGLRKTCHGSLLN